jgi:hypothetical protein
MASMSVLPLMLAVRVLAVVVAVMIAPAVLIMPMTICAPGYILPVVSVSFA